MGFSRQKYWSGLPWPPPEDLPDPGVKPASLASPALAGGFFTTSTTQEAHKSTVRQHKIKIKSKRIWFRWRGFLQMSHLDAAPCPFGELCPRRNTSWVQVPWEQPPSGFLLPSWWVPLLPASLRLTAGSLPLGWGESCTAFLCEILLPGHEHSSACPNYSPRESLGTSCPPVLSTPPCHPPQQVTDAWEFSSLLCNIQLQACLGCSQSLGKHILDPAPCAHF